jgi:uncharacterized protein (TIGR00369 family)
MMSERRSTEAWFSTPPFQAHLGIETVEAAEGCTVLQFGHRPEFGNRKGDVHGGVLATLVDLAMAQALRSLAPDLAGTSTVQMSINYLEPASGRLTARGHVIKLGRTLGIAEATVEDEGGRAVVHATGSFRMIRHKKG